MTKRILIGLFILLMAAVSIIAFNFYKNVKQPLNPTFFEAVPQHAALIIKEENFSALLSKLNSTNMIWQVLVDSTDQAQRLNTQFIRIDSLLASNFKGMVQGNEVMASLHLSGANNYDFIYYFNLPGEDLETKVIQQIKAAFKANPTARAYDGANIYSFQVEGTKWAMCLIKGTLAFSKSTVLIEDVIREVNSEGSLLTDADFKKVLASSGKGQDGNVFVNNKHFSKVVLQFLNKDTKGYCQQLESYAGWSEFDLSIKPNTVALNGFSFADENKQINLFRNQKAQDINITEVVPYNTAFLHQYGLSNVNEFFTQRKNLLKSSNQFFNYQKFLDEQTSNYGIDLEVELLGHMEEEIAFVITESLSEKFYDNKYVVYKVKELQPALSDLKKISISTGAQSDTSSFGDYPIGKLNVKSLFPKLLGKPFVNLTENYYTHFEEYIVFANSPKALENYITALSNEKTLANDDNFEQFEDNLSSSSNCFIYHNIARSVNLYKSYCADDILPILDEKLSTFRKFEAVAFQMTTEKKNLFYNNIVLKYNPVYKQETGSLWEIALDTFTTQRPHLVENHNTGSKEIVIQDDANKLYLIGSTGKILWTKQLQEPIIGRVQQIDVYKNNKLQLLFNTASKLYLIDRNGNNVEKYPVKLPATAVNQVVPMDYDKNRNYRILIGCSDNKVYNYDITGAQVKGWEYTSTQSPARGKMWHFALAGKDYIVIPLNSGEVNVVERSGKVRVKLTNMLPQGNEVFLRVGSSLDKTYMVTADTTGTVVKLYMNDKKEALKLEQVGANATFTSVDFNSDRTPDYAFAWENNLVIADNQNKVLHEMEVAGTLSGGLQILSRELYGLSTADQVYVFDASGNIKDGFPLKGANTMQLADVNKDNTTNLVVALGKTLYLYNLE